MSLLSDYRLVVAPHFHLKADWPSRLRIAAGVEPRAGHYLARLPWRPPSDEELAALTERGDEVIQLLALPGHLRSEWWQLLERGAEALAHGPLPGFEAFAAGVADFLRFKELPLTREARFELLVSDRARGLRSSLAPWAPWPAVAESPASRLFGAVNLGDEEAALVLLPLSCHRMQEELRQQLPGEALPATVGALVDRFLCCGVECLPLRVALAPGEGVCLPRGGVLVDGDREGQREVDVTLLITAVE